MLIFVNMTFVCVQVHNYGCWVKLLMFNVHKFQRAERFVWSPESPDWLRGLPRLLIDVNPASFFRGKPTGSLDCHSPSYVARLRTRGIRPVSALTRMPLCHGA